MTWGKCIILIFLGQRSKQLVEPLLLALACDTAPAVTFRTRRSVFAGSQSPQTHTLCFLLKFFVFFSKATGWRRTLRARLEQNVWTSKLFGGQLLSCRERKKIPLCIPCIHIYSIYSVYNTAQFCGFTSVSFKKWVNINDQEKIFPYICFNRFERIFVQEKLNAHLRYFCLLLDYQTSPKAQTKSSSIGDGT